MDYIVGIDGGGTKTKLAAAGPDGRILYEAQGGPSNICSVPRMTVAENLRRLLEPVMERFGGKAHALCIGSAGIVVPGSADLFVEWLSPYAERVMAFDDAYITLFAGLKEEAGLVLTAGTGSICYGKSQSGRVLRVGGWGHLLGDGGSGYDIGLTSLHYLADCHDQRRPMPPYFEAFLNTIGAATFDELVGAVYERFSEKEQIASLAAIIGRFAEEGDPYASAVLQKCTGRLVDLCCTAAEGLELSGDFAVRLNGSILQKSSFARRSFDAQFKEKYPDCRISPLERDATAGALYLAGRSGPL